MSRLKLEEKWLKKSLPEGFFYPSSTLISGPGGTGKPLVEFAFVSSWLKSGGSVIGIPLQYPTMELVGAALNKLYNIDLKNYHKRIGYIKFAPSINGYKKIGNDTIEANLLKPDVWDEAIQETDNIIEKSDLGTMVFGSALNLLLFSPTYRDDAIKKLESIIKNDKSKTYIFSVSTSAFAEKVKLWEKAADNLMYTRMEKPMKLFFKISRMKRVSFSREEVNVPISRETLMEIKDIAEATRERTIPKLKKI